MKKISTISTLLLVLLMSAGTVFAWPGGHGDKQHGNCDRRGEGMSYEQHEDRMENRLERMAVILDLSDKQKKQMKDLHEKNWKNHQTMRTQMQTSRDELRDYKFGKDFNESEFRAKAQKLADLKTEMMVQRAQHKQNIYALLTPDQQVKAEKLWDMHGEGFQGRGYDRDGKGGHRGCNQDCNGQGQRCGKGYGYRDNS